LSLISSAEPTGVHDLGDRARVIADGVVFLLGRLRARSGT
jgi:hypothetical protein